MDTQNQKNIYVHYGCAFTAPQEWINFDVSPSRLLQKIPIIGKYVKTKLYSPFPKNVRHGDITKGLPIFAGSVSGVYCSHTLEHLTLEDFRLALNNTYKLLKPGGIFRCVVPDLEYAAREYINSLDKGVRNASIEFLRNGTLLGVEKKPKGIEGFFRLLLGNSHHLWMWDINSISLELENAGFTNIRPCKFNDCEDQMFNYVEEIYRFENAVAVECRKN